eukprot:8722514-Pyramimonas_sp.AAC.1
MSRGTRRARAITRTPGQLPMLAVAREASQLRLIGQLDKQEAHRLRLRDLHLRLRSRGSSSTT